jgi:co-chaperonin GroES (HSP10)
MAYNEHGQKVTGDQLPKIFSMAMGGPTIDLTPKEIEERDEIEKARRIESERIAEATRKCLQEKQIKKKTKKLIPYGTRLLVKRRKVDQTSSHIILPDEVASLPTDIADVVAVPEQSFCDKALIAKSEHIINGLAKRAEEGDGAAFEALLKFNEYLRVVTLKPGDVLMIGKYIGTDFLIQETNQYLTVLDGSGIYCRVVEI